MQTLTVELSALKVHNDNVRVSVNDLALEALKSSIRADGLIVPLLVSEPDVNNIYGVIDGGRRLQALNALAEEGLLPSSVSIPIVVRERGINDGEEAAISLAANIMRAPLHPVDAYEAFAKCEANGMSKEGIGLRYGVSLKEVRQRLALGSLSPVIRDAWRNGELWEAEDDDDDDQDCSEEIAQAFTLAPDHKTQEEVYKDLRSKSYLWPALVKEALSGETPYDAEKYLNFVGAESYTERGGNVVVDLFGDDNVISDYPLLRRLADEKLEHEAAKLRNQGWKFVSAFKEIGFDRWQLPQHKPKKSDLEALRTDEENTRLAVLNKVAQTPAPEWEEAYSEIKRMEKSLLIRYFDERPNIRKRWGCVVDVSRNGALEIHYAVDKPKGAGKKNTPGSTLGKADHQPGDISAALHRSLTEVGTLAAQDAAATDPHLTLALAVAAMEQASYGIPVEIRVDGYWDIEARGKPREPIMFKERLPELVAMQDDELLGLLAYLVAPSLNLVEQTANADNDLHQLIYGLLPTGPFNLALGSRLDFDVYFKRTGKLGCIDAIKECGSLDHDEVARWGNKKTTELRTFAAKIAKDEGWLPKALRTDHYKGPGA